MSSNTKRKRKEATNDDTTGNKKCKPNNKIDGNSTVSDPGDSGKLFSNMKLLVIDAGIGKTRAELFRKQLRSHGGHVEDKFHPKNTTHVLVDESVTCQRICQILGISQQPDIFKIKVLKIAWVTACLKNKKTVDVNEYLFDFSSLNQSNKNNDNSSKTDTSQVPSTSSTTVSNTEEKDVEKKLPKVGGMWRAFKKKSPEKTDIGGSESDSSYVPSDEEQHGNKLSDDDDEPQLKIQPSGKKVLPGHWICAHSSANKQENHNKHITDKLQELAEVYESTNDKWRAMGYKKAIGALKKHQKTITSFEEAQALPNVGARLAEKIWEIVESGELRKLNELSGQEEIQAMKLFTGIWGAGASTARTWVQAGFRTLDDIRNKAHLTRQQKIGLQYYDELLDRMPRSEAAEIEDKVKKAAYDINPSLICMACGSYRRGKVTCGDVDVLITHPDGKSHKGVFTKILTSMHESGFLTDDLVTQEDNGNQRKYLGVCKLPGENTKHRRLDIIVVPYDEYACAVMYFTGSAHFNRSMRHLAKKMNMSLTEHSLNKDVVRHNSEKINRGIPIPTMTEEDVFKGLGLKYRPPVERDH